MINFRKIYIVESPYTGMQPLTLRGHHVEALAEHYAKKQGATDEADPTYGLIDLDPMADNTDSEKVETITKLYDLLLKSPDQEIKITFGIDSVCLACPKLPLGCPAESNEINDPPDRVGLEAYGLEEGKRYTINDLLIRFDLFRQVTGYASPRQEQDGQLASLIALM